jgi:glyoxylase-like metal-dependent hydrolase (beta-lactamase superfamily II)
VECAYTNLYLVEDGDRLTMVDAGVPSAWSDVDRALDELGRSREEIAALVLTHAHFDHIGIAERLRREIAVPVFVHENDVPLTQHPLQYAHERSRIPYLANPKAMPIVASLLRSRAFFPTPIAEVTRFSDENGDLGIPGSPRIVFTPGHTLGHCAIHFPDRDAVISADALVTLDPYTGGTGPQIVSGAATADSDRALSSLDALEETDAKTVLPGHGPVWRDGAAAAAASARSAGPS